MEPKCKGCRSASDANCRRCWMVSTVPGPVVRELTFTRQEERSKDRALEEGEDAVGWDWLLSL